jgi:hypothetical protein
MIAGCATVAPPRPELTNIPPLENGWSRLFISAGHYKSFLPDVDLKNTSNTGPVYINDQKVGSTAYKEYIAVDLKAGIYEVYWMPTIPDKYYPEKTSIKVQDNQVRYFSCDMARKGYGAAFGVVGVLASDYLVKGMLTEEPLDKEGKLVSYYKFTENLISNGITTPTSNKEVLMGSQKDKNVTKFNNRDVDSRLLKLKEMYEHNLITKDEYDSKRKEILGEL